jgi:hypothetical protein
LCICTGLKEKADDPFASLPDASTMEVVLRAVASERGYTEKYIKQVLAVLHGKCVCTVHNLRALNKEDIKELGLPPVVARYLLRTKAGGDQ